MSSKAVLFGIDYLHSNNPLRGCANDVINMSEYVKNTLNYDTVKVYTEQETPTKVQGQHIIRILCKLAMESHSKKLNRVLIHFSGHGVGIIDRNNDEKDGKDEAICPVDYEKVGVITDDILKRILQYFHPDTKVTCIFDCCHSGTIGDLKYRLSETSENTIDNVKDKFISNVTILSGCRDDQTSSDAYNVSGNYQFTGAMTSCLLDCLRYRHEIHGSVDAVTLIGDVRTLLVRRGFKQIPILTSSRELSPNSVIF